ncbi:MAG: alpha-amylase family glycosyl hydrolase, partial [Bacteroidota bacterium]
SANIFGPIKLIPAGNDQETAYSDSDEDTSAKKELRDAIICEADLRMLPAGSSFSVLRKKIPDLKRSGISLLCLSPLHPMGELNRKGAAGNPFSVQDYYRISAGYGTFKDLKSLITEAHNNGIKVIMDFIANCTSWDNSLLMQYPEWYAQNEKGEILAPYAGANDVAKLNYDRHELRKYMIAMLEYWFVKVGFDGFRCIGSGNIPVDFWLSARIQLEKNKPVVLISQESIPEQQEGAFNISGTFDAGTVLNKILRGTTSSVVFQKLLNRESRLFSDGTLFARSDEFRKHSNDPNQERESIVFRLIHPGIPVLGAEEITGNSDVFSLVEQLIGIRAQHPALIRGRYAFITTGDARTIYSFVRTIEQDTVAVIMNISNEPRIALLKGDVLLSHQWQNVVTKKKYTVNRNGLSLELPACGFAVLQPIE